MNELKKSIEFTEEVLEEKVQNMQRKVSTLEEKVEEIYDYQIDPDEINKMFTDSEDCSRRSPNRWDYKTKWRELQELEAKSERDFYEKTRVRKWYYY